MPPRRLLLAFLLLPAIAAGALEPQATSPTQIGRVVVLDAAMRELVAPDARIDRIAEGFTWAEGPTWLPSSSTLLFTDVPQNTLYSWNAREGLKVFLKPSGYDGPDDGTLREAGANGLLTEADGQVLLADSGNRALSRLDPTRKQKTVLAARYEGKRFNSPNDIAKRADGRIYFTDPPYGLAGMDKSPLRELPIAGVYRLDPDGSVHLVDDSLRFPNGVALSPDDRTLYVSNSDDQRPIWMAYTLDDRGEVISKRVFADASTWVGKDAPGLPDGMAVAYSGHLFATGPGGVLVFDAQGKRLGRIETGGPVANVAFGDDGHTLYLTSEHLLARVPVKAIGLEFAEVVPAPAASR